MKRSITISFSLAACAFALSLSSATAAGIYGPGATVVGIDIGGATVDSSYPVPNEAPGMATDQDPMTKYLNFGGQGTGIILTPAFGASTVQSIQFTTGGDAPNRDPLMFDLFGTNDSITSTQNSYGNTENWTSIASGSTGLENLFDMGDSNEHREEAGVVQDFTNSNPYDSYRIFFPQLRDNNTIMQVADISLFTAPAGGGDQILAAGDNAIAISSNGVIIGSSTPGAEIPVNTLDMDSNTKYLNFGKEGSGLIVGDGTPTIVNSLTFTTANDAPERDPLTWELYGTNDAIASAENSDGSAEAWSLVAVGGTDLLQFDANDPTGRGQTGATQPFGNSTAYGAYRLVFTGLRNTAAANSMQVADIVFGGSKAIPEPTSLALALLGLAACGCGRRRS